MEIKPLRLEASYRLGEVVAALKEIRETLLDCPMEIVADALYLCDRCLAEQATRDMDLEDRLARMSAKIRREIPDA